MSNTSLIALLLVIVAVIGGGYWFYTSGGQGVSKGTSQERGAKESVSVGLSFRELLGLGQSQKCTYEYNDGGNVSSGTMYVTEGGERVRGEFNVTQSGAGPMQMFMVRADGYNYMWGSAMPQGIKMQVTEENRGQLFDVADANAAALNNTQYTCEPWSVDSGMFAVPTNVQFTDMGDMMKMMGKPKFEDAMRVEGSTDGSANIDVKAMQCAACDQAGAAREQCRQALGCK